MEQTRFYFADHFTPFYPKLARLAWQQKQVPAGHVLAAAGQEITDLFYIIQGFCCFSLVDDQGNEAIQSFHGPGSLYPVKCRQFHFVLEPAFRYVALSPAQVLCLKPEAVQSLVRTDPDFAVAALDFHTVYANMQSARLVIHQNVCAVQKVATFLYLAYPAWRQQGQGIGLTQEQVAAVLGVSRVQVARAYRVLRQQKAIATHRSGVTILDMEKLREHCSASFLF